MAGKRRLRQLLVGGALGSLGTLFLDPQQGRRRRKGLVDRAGALGRRTGRRAERAGHLQEEPKDFDDVTLARKVETEIFRDAEVPKGQIDVNVQEGVVQLRGEVPTPELLNDLVAKTRGVQGVRDVESLLHLPGTPAPMHQ
jgi:gas vesicle protein